MIIDTNDFEIGDTIYCCFVNLANKASVSTTKIKGFKYLKNTDLIVITEGQFEIKINGIYKDKTECQLFCDSINNTQN